MCIRDRCGSASQEFPGLSTGFPISQLCLLQKGQVGLGALSEPRVGIHWAYTQSNIKINLMISASLLFGSNMKLCGVGPPWIRSGPYREKIISHHIHICKNWLAKETDKFLHISFTDGLCEFSDPTPNLEDQEFWFRGALPLGSCFHLSWRALSPRSQ